MAALTRWSGVPIVRLSLSREHPGGVGVMGEWMAVPQVEPFGQM